jgi:hypothetical protein
MSQVVMGCGHSMEAQDMRARMKLLPGSCGTPLWNAVMMEMKLPCNECLKKEDDGN